MGKKLTTKEFIDKANIVHKNKFIYSEEYISNKIKTSIICPIHGLFKQRPNDHLNGDGCSKCSGKYKVTNEEFINEASLIHNDKYDYSLINYVNSKTKINIICPIHGEFEQTPDNHCSKKQGCFKCGVENRFLNKKEFIDRAKLIHGDKYSYSSSNYFNYKTKIEINCAKHGLFYKTPSAHIIGKEGCRKCWEDKNKLTLEKLINGVKLIHGDKYDYSLSNYINSWTKIKILCSKHGEFEQRPSDHLRGNGCPICRESTGESKIREFLKSNKIKYIRQFKFKECKDKYPLPFDFYLPDLNMCIEFNGVQHYEYNPFFHRNENNFSLQQKRDKIKNIFCEDNNINLLVIKYSDDVNKLEEIIAL
jgi:hypothetical protein